jgi:hypothetical protein
MHWISDKKLTLAEHLVACAAVEGRLLRIHFLAQEARFNAQSNVLKRDHQPQRGMHTDFACPLFSHMKHRPHPTLHYIPCSRSIFFVSQVSDLSCIIVFDRSGRIGWWLKPTQSTGIIDNCILFFSSRTPLIFTWWFSMICFHSSVTNQSPAKTTQNEQGENSR